MADKKIDDRVAIAADASEAEKGLQQSNETQDTSDKLHKDDVVSKAATDDQPRLPKDAPSTNSADSRSNEKKPTFTHPLAQEQMGPEYLVDFDGQSDPYRPHNWAPSKKLTTLILYSLTALGTAFNSAIFESAVQQVSGDYGVSTEVATLGTSLTLIGFAIGPLLWAPLSELYGRKWVILGPYFIAACFAFGCGSSKDIQSILITRFFQGWASSSVLANMGGMLGDIYIPKERGGALAIFSLCVVGGPLTAPIVGSAIVTSYLRWRWTMFIVGIMQMTTAVLATVVIDETYAPALLARKARKLRLETKNWALHAKHEEWDSSFGELARKYLVRPFLLMVNPICFLMSFYASFVYALIYGSLAAVPIIFGQRRGWSPVVASLPFLAMLLGCFVGLTGNIMNTKLYVKAIAKNGGKPVPEARLYPMMVGSFLLTFGLFILGWTGDMQVTWVAPCIGLFLIGAGFFPIFQASVNYIVDAFLPVAASALATTTFMRSIFAAAFPLFMGPMLNALGIGWGISVLGFVGVAMLPVPFLFFAFGARIRALGKALPT